MTDISLIAVPEDNKEKVELTFESACPIFIAFPKTLTEEQLVEFKEEMTRLLSQHKEGEGFIIRTIVFGNAVPVLEEVVSRSKALFKSTTPKWEDSKKGRKPLFDAYRKEIRRSDIIVYFDSGRFTDKWLKNYIMEEAIENHLPLKVRHFEHKGEEDFEFLEKRLATLDDKLNEARASFHSERPIMTEDQYKKLEVDYETLQEALNSLRGKHGEESKGVH